MSVFESSSSSKKKRDPKAPTGRLTAYMLFCRDHRVSVTKENPNITFGDIGKELGRQWKESEPTIKEKYENLAQQDKLRYEKEMEIYQHNKGTNYSSDEETHESPKSNKKKKKKKDPNAPKPAKSAYVIFCQEARPLLREQFPDLNFGEVLKHIGEKWKSISNEDKKKIP